MHKWILIAVLVWFAAVQEIKTPPNEIPVKCSINEKKASCAHTSSDTAKPTINTFPQHVRSKASELEAMDISGNRYRRANFNEYNRLIRLDAEYIEFVDIPSRNNFKNGLSKLKALEELDTSGVKFFNTPYNLTGIIWPKKLIRLILSNMSLSDVTNLHLLQNLEELDLSLNSLQTLPKLNLTAPLITINLKDNPLVTISVLQIAPFCEMQTFLLGGEGLANFTSADNYNVCAPVEKWLLEHKIEKDQFTCLPHNLEGLKNISFPAEAVKAYNECMAQLPSTSVFELLLYAVFFAVLFPLLYFGNEAWNKYQSKKMAPPPKPVKRSRKKRRINTTVSTTTTTVPSTSTIDVEAGQLQNV